MHRVCGVSKDQINIFHKMPPRRGGRRRGNPQRPRNQGLKSDTMDSQIITSDFTEDNIDIKSEWDAVTEAQTKTDVDDSQESQGNEEFKDVKTEVKIEAGVDIKQEEPNPSDALEEIKKEGNNSEINETEVKLTTAAGENEADASIDLPYKIKVSHLPANYILGDFIKHVKSTFRVEIPNIISPRKNSPWLILQLATKEEQENLIRLLHNHIWKKKTLRAITYYGTSILKRKADEELPADGKKPKVEDILQLTLEEEILSESLPLYSVPYEQQNEITRVDVEILSNKLHAFMCVRNPALAGWAEAMCEKNNKSIFKIEPLKPSPVLEGYRNKCKFRIGKNTDGEITVGFCLNDNENKILGVQPGDKLIHLPDSMKYAAKKFEDFIRASDKGPYNKKQKSGFWDHIIIRIAPEGKLMLVVVMYHNHLPDEEINQIKAQVKDYFENGDGKDCNLYSLYFQVMCDKAPVLSPDKLDLLMGESHFLENICGLKFYVGPFSILNVNSSSSENIYKSIAELAEPTQETTVLDLCSGTGGIAFTIADKCKNVIAIESHADHIKDALKTKELNNITNVEFIKGKVEDELSGVFEKLGDAPVIPIIDPPRQGLVQKAISQLRANQNIKKLVYVCSNSKMGAKNFLDLCASSEKKEGTFGNPLNVVFAGLPFLPVRAIPVDVAPYTLNNTIIILFERIDPSTFPPAKNPPPAPIKRPQVKKDDKKKKRHYGRRGGRGRSSGAGLMGSKPRMSGSGGKGGFSGQQGFNSGRFPFPFMSPMEPALSLVAKYERRIAELEQQDLAFKAGLTMGLQALNSRGGPGGGLAGNNFENFANNFNPNSGAGGGNGNISGGGGNNSNMSNNNNNNFGGFRNSFSRDTRNVWQRGGEGGGGRNLGNIGMGQFGGGNNFGGLGFNGAAFNFNNTGGGNLGGYGNFGGMGGNNNYNQGFGEGNSGGGGKRGGFRNNRGKRRRR